MFLSLKHKEQFLSVFKKSDYTFMFSAFESLSRLNTGYVDYKDLADFLDGYTMFKALTGS